MAAKPDTTTFGVSIVPIEQRNTGRSTPVIQTLDSPTLTPVTSREDLKASTDIARNDAKSPFYDISPSALPHAHVRQTSQSSIAVNEKDLEAGLASPLTTRNDNPFTSKISVDYNKECNMWPSKQTLMQARLAEKKRKRDAKFCGGCGPVVEFWGRFSARQKLCIKILIALFVVGIAVAIGIGISFAVNGTTNLHGEAPAPTSLPQAR